MESLRIDLWTCDVGADAGTPEAYADLILALVQSSWHGGADAVVFPEYTWMVLERFVEGPDKLRGVSDLFWKQLWPKMRPALAQEDKLVVLGTVPFAGESGGQNVVFNRAPILCAGQDVFQDKLNLTPWETKFARGDVLRLITFRGLTFAVVICLDIEVPELSVLLRGRGVDCLLVPSATETLLGVERVGRCASARAVELGCFVGVSQLVGQTTSELVDENVGRLSWFAPSQKAFKRSPRQTAGELLTEGWHVLSESIDPHQLDIMRRNRLETNPAFLTPAAVRCEIAS